MEAYSKDPQISKMLSQGAKQSCSRGQSGLLMFRSDSGGLALRLALQWKPGLHWAATPRLVQARWATGEDYRGPSPLSCLTKIGCLNAQPPPAPVPGFLRGLSMPAWGRGGEHAGRPTFKALILFA